MSDIENSHEYNDKTVQPLANTAGERRRAALAEIDEASFSWVHVKACLVAGVGFFTDAYDIFSINIAALAIGYVYHNPVTTNGVTVGGSNTPNQDLGIKVAHSVGTLFGQLLFGFLADRIGRKRMYGIELIIIIIGTLGTAVAGAAPGVSIYGVIIMWRFIMGLGIGGDYPLSAVITSEFAARRIRGRMMAAVFSAQGWGNLSAAIIAIIAIVAYKGSVLADPTDYWVSVDQFWRIVIGMGMVPAVIALYFRLTIPETPRYTMDVERDINKAAKDANEYIHTGKFTQDPDAVVERAEMPKASWKDFCQFFGQWKNGKVLFGTAFSWFALDVAFYGLGLNSSTILTTIGFGNYSSGASVNVNVYQSIYNSSVGNIILAVGGLIPGYYATMLLVDKWGRKPIQLMGFAMLTAIFICMGFGYEKLIASNEGKKAFVFLYCLANFFQNFGPNTTTFIVPGEVFPTRYRSTAHGISAASGKLGAIIAQVGFSRLKDIGGPNAFIGHILEIFALFMLLGFFATLLIPETKGISLEDLSNEDQSNFVGGSSAYKGQPISTTREV